MTKVNVVSGFLGAGKTTLIAKLLKEVFAGERVVLVENEFGEIGIDGGFLKDSGIEIREINSGCICCSLRGDFQEALRKVIDTYQPARIIIEPSGVGKLSDILKIIRSVDGVELDSYSSVVDAARCKIYHKNFKEFFDDQISTAACIILSRTQTILEEKLTEDIAIIRELNPTARVITTPWDELSGNSIFEAMTGAGSGFPKDLGPLEDDEDEDEHEHHHEHHHEDHCKDEHDHEHHHHHHHEGELDADDVFDSIGMETVRQYGRDELKEILAKLPENIVRSKGIVEDKEGGWLFFDYVPGDYNVRKGSAAYTGLITVIGEHVDEAAMKELFGVK
ncbi:MAG: GTP-binding protein [Erysipelotrichia bacterium]|nr:GTP-binding protein [Erysipelotrichia bacterium]